MQGDQCGCSAVRKGASGGSEVIKVMGLGYAGPWGPHCKEFGFYAARDGSHCALVGRGGAESGFSKEYIYLL